MSTTVNTGDQNVYVRYNLPYDGEHFARLFDRVLAPGIYQGLNPQKLDNDTARVSAGKCLIRDANGRSVPIEFESHFDVQPTEGSPYIVLRYGWVNEEERFAEVLTLDSFGSEDVVIAETLFDGSGNITGFDEGDRTLPRDPGAFDSFVNLLDTPDSYLNESGSFLRVNSAENALEYVNRNDTFSEDIQIDAGDEGVAQTVNHNLSTFAVNVDLYKQDGTNWNRLSGADIDRLVGSDTYEVAFAETGTYKVVISNNGTN
jgi:hypothetical protein